MNFKKSVGRVSWFILGLSGGGKTTLISLLMKFHDISDGKILINNIDIKNISEEEYYKLFAYTRQNSVMFSGSILDNLKITNPSATQKEIEFVVNICGIDKFIGNINELASFDVGQRGMNLSGGQKQRIAIARSLLRKNAKILS